MPRCHNALPRCHALPQNQNVRKQTKDGKGQSAGERTKDEGRTTDEGQNITKDGRRAKNGKGQRTEKDERRRARTNETRKAWRRAFLFSAWRRAENPDPDVRDHVVFSLLTCCSLCRGDVPSVHCCHRVVAFCKTMTLRWETNHIKSSKFRLNLDGI